MPVARKRTAKTPVVVIDTVVFTAETNEEERPKELVKANVNANVDANVKVDADVNVDVDVKVESESESKAKVVKKRPSRAKKTVLSVEEKDVIFVQEEKREREGEGEGEGEGEEKKEEKKEEKREEKREGESLLEEKEPALLTPKVAAKPRAASKRSVSKKTKASTASLGSGSGLGLMAGSSFVADDGTPILYSLADDGDTNMPTTTENVILKLNIDSQPTDQGYTQCFENEFFEYEPTIGVPDAYDRNEFNDFASHPCDVKNVDEEPSLSSSNLVVPKASSRKKNATSSSAITSASTSSAMTKTGGKRVFDHLSEFITRDEWPLSTNVSCFWCCHGFSNTPLGIPTKYSGGKFHVVGCFCSLECAAAYNFYSNELRHDIWESYSLINLLSRTIQYKDTIRMAPPRHALKMFGGYMDIYEFRGQSESSKVISTHTYPMVAVIQQLEEVNDTDSFNYGHRKNLFIPIDKQKLFMLETKMKLERTKPLYNNKNTLDHTMNLKME
jgi:hypothetical protein